MLTVLLPLLRATVPTGVSMAEPFKTFICWLFRAMVFSLTLLIVMVMSAVFGSASVLLISTARV